MSSNLTDTIFAQWKKILQNDFTRDREIILNLSNENSNVYINFVIKQGRERYNINERSLGFRWFFLFLLFTLYGAKNSNKQTLFLLDEPASYLHARAQQALLDSFPRITEDGSQIIYSTHSHYLINPHWLEQAYIVSNDAIDNESLDDKIKKNIEISIHKYRRYVNDNPTKTTYFQPVLDKLNVSVSKLDFVKPSILVEGKSDFLILEYGFKVLLKKDDIAIIPMSGAHGYQGVISLLYGWGVPFLACFDDDKAGNREKLKILDEYPFLREEQVITLNDIDNNLKGKEISYLLTQYDKEFIQKIMQTTGADKSKIQLFFSEALAKNELVSELSDNFKKTIQIFYDYFKKYFENLT
ncbi:MAG: AAA family ATPase [Neisseria zoodegmatis]|uniref:ATP-dependent nuclease n=1 Tax=Neisseria zoodegmatis TaxID=326523 RepID=UPI0026EAF1AF|nr:AAA family ATPase [Neisseria zoodegmatis]MDO5069821.1 AAA family ATPase [Neisseria zoodegmatis]